MIVRYALVGSVLLLASACTPDRSLDTATPHWAGEYRGGTTDDYVTTMPKPVPPLDDQDIDGTGASATLPGG